MRRARWRRPSAWRAWRWIRREWRGRGAGGAPGGRSWIPQAAATSRNPPKRCTPARQIWGKKERHWWFFQSFRSSEVWTHGSARTDDAFMLTWILKETRDPLLVIDLCSFGVAVSMRQTMDTHWFRFSESPTNASRLSRSFSRSLSASNLFTMNGNYSLIPQGEAILNL